MRVLVACEYSGRVRDAFIARGHSAVSCDLLPTDVAGKHYQADVFEVLDSQPFDLMVAFPPCTYLCRSGARWHSGSVNQELALQFVWRLMSANVPRIAIENPIGAISSHIRKPDQIVQPWWFGHPETKATCLWLKGLPLLVPTRIVGGREPRTWFVPPGPDRWKIRSTTLPGVANAMAERWG